MGKKEIFLKQLAACHNETNWFATLEDALKGLSAKEARWHHEKLENSIWEIVNHLIYWNKNWLHRFKGIPIEKSVANNEASFFRIKETDMLTENDWQETVNELNAVMFAWQNTIKESDETKFDELLSKNNFMPISNVIFHNAYHIGQIVYIRKLQGSWQPIKWD